MPLWPAGLACLWHWSLVLAGAVADVRPPVEGRVWQDTNGNGRFDPGETGLAGILVTDGYDVATTDDAGRYRLQPSPTAHTIAVHQPRGLAAPRFWRPLEPGRTTYDFALGPAATPPTVRFLVVADQETATFEWTAALRERLAADPTIAFLLCAGDICNDARGRDGLPAHARELSQATLGVPIHYAIGNHDIIPRQAGEPDLYGATCGPYWYSFEVGDVLFVVAPMYHLFSPPLPYRLADFGDWLRRLLDRFPRQQPKVLLSHDLLDLNGLQVATSGAPIVLDDHGFVACVYGHKHMNLARRYPSGRLALSVAPPNKAGCGFYPPSFRTVEIAAGQVSSAIQVNGVRQHLAVTAPTAQLVRLTPEGRLDVSVAAVHAGADLTGVTVACGGSRAALRRVGTWSWRGSLPVPPAAPGESLTLTATARTALGEWSTSSEFCLPAPDRGRLRWQTDLPGTGALAEPLVIGDQVIVAVADDDQAVNGGLVALDAATGATRWHYRTGHSVRQTLRQRDGVIYAIDARGNLHAVEAATGQRRWLNAAAEDQLSPSSSGLALAGGLVVGGYGALLRGCDAATGETVWRNAAWVERTPGEDRLAVAGDLVLVTSQLGGLFAHEAATGQVRWCFPERFVAATALPDDDLVVVKGERDLHVLRLSDGREVRRRTLGALKSASAPVAAGDRWLFGTIDQGLLAVAKADLATVWQFRPGPAIFPTGYYSQGRPPTVEATPLVRGDAVWVAANDGCLYELDLATGHQRRRIGLGLPLCAAPAIDGSTLYAVDLGGRVCAVRVDGSGTL